MEITVQFQKELKTVILNLFKEPDRLTGPSFPSPGEGALQRLSPTTTLIHPPAVSDLTCCQSLSLYQNDLMIHQVEPLNISIDYFLLAKDVD